MGYTVLMLKFQDDGSVQTYRLAGFFPSPEDALEAGNREIAEKGAHGELGFQIHDVNGKTVHEARRGESNG